MIMIFIEIKRMRWLIFGVSHFSENYQTRFQLFQSKAITSYSEFSTSKIVNFRLSTGKAPQKSAKRKKNIEGSTANDLSDRGIFHRAGFFNVTTKVPFLLILSMNTC